jgi:hypothetical protein
MCCFAIRLGFREGVPKKTAYQFIPFLNELKKRVEKLLSLFIFLRRVWDGVKENDAARIDQRKATAETSDVVRGPDVECEIKVCNFGCEFEDSVDGRREASLDSQFCNEQPKLSVTC